MVEGGMKCVKYLLFAFNLIFVLAAIGLIAVGAWVKVALKNYDVALGEISSAAALIIAVGVLIFFIAFFGCCGAIKENRICVLVFATLLVIIFILEIAGAIAGFVFKGKAEKYIADNLQKPLKYDSFWKDLQNEFKCCGISGPDDWNKTTNGSLPATCCKTKDPCTNTRTDTDLLTEGCLGTFVEWVRRKIGYVAGVALGFAFIQVVGITFACCLAVAIKKEYEVV